MEIRWTEEQRKVIESRRKNVLVSAAAGSGKTAVLAARILSRLQDREKPCDIDRILVVTFTNAAAAEMRERIGKAIAEALESDPENGHLRRQATLLHHAQITTYDSFCLYLVRNYFHRIDLDPSLRVADPGEVTLLRKEAMDRVFAEEYEEAREDFALLLDSFGSRRSDEAVRDMVECLGTYAMSDPWPEEWLDGCEKRYQVNTAEELMHSEFLDTVMKQLRAILCGAAEEMRVLSALAGDPDGPNVYQEVLSEEAETIGNFAEIDSFLNLRASFLAREEKRLPAARNYQGSEEKKQYITNERKKIKNELNKIEKDFFSILPEEMVKRIQYAASSAGALLRMTRRFLALFREIKGAKNVLDFSDMEQLALRILIDRVTKEPTEVAEKLREYFEEVMVDEYQDSNFLQEEILRAVTRQEDGRKNLFLVGDVKQSIYRFRLSRPELFMEKYKTFPVGGEFEERIDLHKNFRSREGILEAANDIFLRLMGEDLGLLEYNGDTALYPGASYPENPEEPVRILLAEEGEGEEKLAREGAVIAEEIKRLMKEEHVTGEDGALRSIRYSDIVILLRSPGGSGDELVSILKDRGIPAMRPSETGYFSAHEVQVVLSMLQIIDNPRQDIPLTAVMRSPIGGFSDEALARIRQCAKDSFFYECVEKSSETEEFRRMLGRYRDMARDTRVHELIERILTETGYLSYVTALPAGERRRENLRMLVEKAVSYEKTSYHGLYHFVRYIENIRKYEIDFGEADPAQGQADTVRILSIHKSKGLEFPVVFLSQTGKKFNRSDERDKLLVHPEYGLGLFAVDGRRRTKKTTVLREGMELLTRTENLGEELRVLYVALTRAKEKLILTGVTAGAEQKKELLLEMARVGEKGRLSYFRRASAGCYLDWILPAVLSYGKKYNVECISEDKLEKAELTEETFAALTREAVRNVRPREEAELPHLLFQYPYKKEQDIHAKVSVSELKHQAMIFEEGESSELEWVEKTEHPSAVPSFAADGSERNRGAERGSAVHRVLECMDFTAISNFNGLDRETQLRWTRGEIAKMREDGRITPEMEELVNPAVISVFLSSKLAHRMHEAAMRGELFKEKPFVMGLPASEVYHLESSEIILVQGIIDVFFREGEDYVIMDYKTDRVNSSQELKNRYQTQLDLYADAVARNKRAKVREKLIYSFHLGEVVTL